MITTPSLSFTVCHPAASWSLAAVRTGDSLIRKAVGYGGRSGRRCRTGRRSRTSRKFPRPNYKVIHGSTSRPFSAHLKKKNSNSSACFFLAGRDFCYSFSSCFFFFFFFLVRLLFFYHLLRCLRAVPRGLYILPLILYAYRHHGLHDWGRDLFEPFEEIQVCFLCTGVLCWFNLVANRMIGWYFWGNRVVRILDSFDKCSLDSGF